MAKNALQAVLALLHDFSHAQQLAVRTGNITDVSRQLSPQCERYIAPDTFARSMGLPTGVGASNEAYEQQTAPMLPLIEATSPTIHDTVVDTERHRASIHLTHYIKLFNVDDPFNIENMFILHLEDDDKLIKKIVEFTDPIESQRYFEQLQKIAGAQS